MSAVDRLGNEQDDETPAHTPGPWTIDEGDIRAPDGVVVAVVTGFALPHDEALIAAAPDLLNALAWMVCNCPLCSRDVRFVEGVMADGLRCGNCYRARQVLDKAVPA